MKVISIVSFRSKGKFVVAFISLLMSLSLSLAGCGSLLGHHTPTVSVGPVESVLTPDKKPYSWPDGTMGVMKEADGEAYRFFAASAGFPLMTKGTFSDPIRDNIHELKIEGVPARYHYCAGGPIYTSDQDGILLMFYHAEIYISPPGILPFYSELGLAKSSDGGMTWKDLGLIITPHASIQSEYFQISHGSLDMGWGAYAVVGKYFYVYFKDLLRLAERNFRPVNLAVARAKIEDVLDAAKKGSEGVRWEKYYNGSWDEPGIGGRSSPLAESEGDLIIMSDVAYSSYLKKYIGLAVGQPWPNTRLNLFESEDGIHWSNYRKIVDDEGHNYYATIIGLGKDPHLLNREFFIYYVNSLEYAATGNRNKDGVLYRRRVTIDGS